MLNFAHMKHLLPILLLLLLAAAMPAFSQGCAVCTNTAAQLGAESAKGLNRGIIMLAMLPLTIIGTIGVMWYRRQRHS